MQETQRRSRLVLTVSQRKNTTRTSFRLGVIHVPVAAGELPTCPQGIGAILQPFGPVGMWITHPMTGSRISPFRLIYVLWFLVVLLAWLMSCNTSRSAEKSQVPESVGIKLMADGALIELHLALLVNSSLNPERVVSPLAQLITQARRHCSAFFDQHTINAQVKKFFHVKLRLTIQNKKVNTVERIEATMVKASDCLASYLQGKKLDGFDEKKHELVLQIQSAIP